VAPDSLPDAVRTRCTEAVIGVVWQLRYAETFLTSCHDVFNLSIYRDLVARKRPTSRVAFEFFVNPPAGTRSAGSAEL
jgi:hypothetical protein